MLKKSLKYLTVGFICLPAVSCDEGKIYDEVTNVPDQSGLTVHFTGTVEGLDQWYSGYSVVVAGFNEDAFAVISKQVVGDGGEISLTISNIPSEVRTMELCVINNLRRRIATYASIDVATTADREIEFNVGTVDAGMYHTIQEVVFDASCVQCHGGSSHAAAGLYLTGSESYDNLVDKPSAVIAGMDRVKPYDAEGSVLWRAVATDVSGDWSFNHSELLNSSSSDLIRSWIDNGAKI